MVATSSGSSALSRAVAAFRQSAWAIGVCAALMAASVILQWQAWRDKCATYDEPTHLIAAYLQTAESDFRVDPENPPLWRYYIAAGMARVQVDRTSQLWNAMLRTRAAEGTFVRDTLYSTPANDPDALLRAARSRMILLGCVLAGVSGWWAWRLAGNLAAIVAVGALCLDPNFLAHAPLVKNDVSIALCLMLLMAGVWLLGEKATALRFIAVALMAAAAINVKFTGILAIPMAGLALLLRSMMPRPWQCFGRSACSSFGRLCVAAALMTCLLLVAWASIWACYRFRFSPTPASDQHFGLTDILRTQAKGDWIAAHGGVTAPPPGIVDDLVQHWHPGLSTQLTLAAMKHRLLPEAFLVGLLHLSGQSETRLMFLAGSVSYAGWWCYFPLAMLYKTPLATLTAFGLAGVYWIVCRGQFQKEDSWAIAVAAMAPAIYFVSAVASHVNVGIRHLLPLYPFLYVLLGVVTARSFRQFPRSTKLILSVLMVGLAVETWISFPDFMPFFNAAAGGWRQGVGLLGDSNIDWGQDLPALAEWQRQNPDRQLYLCYFGTADPRYYKIRYVNVPGSTAPPDQNQPADAPRVIAISAAMLRNPLIPAAQHDLFRNLQMRPPLTVLGHTIYLYALR
jgi:4-amino-4-deoxy-L-arabinose transferase-like glycosyltransferase